MAKGGKREVSGGSRRPVDGSGSVGEDDHLHGGLPLTQTHPDAESITAILEQPAGKKKKRHTAQQTQQMEAMFLESSHPDYMQRLKLSEELGLTPEQVLFWFQNRRTMMKVQKEREEKKALLEENERLWAENNRLRAAMRNMSCPTCGNPTRPTGAASTEAQRLRFENACLREQVERWSRAVAMYGILPAQPFNRRRYAEPPPAGYRVADVIDAPSTSAPSFEKVGTPDELSG